MPSTAHAAFLRAEYTPEPGELFDRLGGAQLAAEGVHSPLFLRLALFADDDGMAAILALDQPRIEAPVADELRVAVAEGAGCNAAQVLVHATHTHNGPILAPWRPRDPHFNELDRLCVMARQLASEARAALRPAFMRAALVPTPGWAFCRRNIYRAADGREQVGTHGPRSGTDFLRPESPDEDALVVAVVEDEYRAVLGGFVSFPCHPTTMYGVSHFSADYPGVMSRALDAAFNGTFLALTGTAGDQSPANGIPGLSDVTGPEGCARMGEALARAAIAGCRGVPLLPVSGVRVHARILPVEQRAPRAEQVETAWAHVEALARGEREPDLSRRLYGYAWHFYGNLASIDDWLACDLIGMWEARRRTFRRAIIEPIEVQGIALGHLAIVGIPGELFSVMGREIRESGHFPVTMAVEHCNAFAGYIPHEEDFARGGYECCFALQSRLVPTAGAAIVRAAREILGELQAPAACTVE